MNLKDKSFEEIFLYLSFLLFLFFVPLSIAISQSFLFLSILLFFYLLLKGKAKIEIPSIFLPLLFYSFFTILSTIFSIDFKISLEDNKELLLFLIVPLLYSSFKEEKIFLSFNYAISFAIILSFLMSLAQYKGITFPQERVSGFLGHYMTQAGISLLFVCLSLPMILITEKVKKVFWGLVSLFALFSMILTFTRSAWIGAVVAISMIFALFKPRLLIVGVPLIVLVILISPMNVKKRVISIFDLNDETNRDRIHMGVAGIRIISNYPFFGSGPDTVRLIYSKYKPAKAVRDNPHLHNNILQIFAERGVFALLSWLWFIYLALKKNFEVFRKSENKFFKYSSLGAIGAIAGLFISGLFEYNFGDSEVKMFFLYLITYPLLILRKNKVETKNFKGDLR